MTLTMSPEQIAAEATLLDEAERTRTQMRQTTSVYPTMTMDDAYAIQSAWPVSYTHLTLPTTPYV